jgi:exodeoxyribonuclease VII large subunit
MELHELERSITEFHPKNIVQEMQQRLDNSTLKLSHFTRIRLREFRNRLDILQNELKELSPQEALKRGYAFILQNRKLLNSVKKVELKERLDLLLADGRLEAEITAIEVKDK